MGWTVTLFILATIYTATNTWKYTRQATVEFTAAETKEFTPLFKYLLGNDQKTAWDSITAIISRLMNTTAHSILVHRCYVLRNREKYVLLLLAFGAFFLNGMDLGCTIANAIAISDTSKHSNVILGKNAMLVDKGVAVGIALFQIVLTFITGVSIWSNNRRKTRYTAIMAVVIDSGMLYATTLLTLIILTFVMDNGRTGFIPWDFSAVSVLMSGIAPTLVVARVDYRKLDSTAKQTVSAPRCDLESQENHQKTSTIDRQPPALGVDFGNPLGSEVSLASVNDEKIGG
ncbi:hypothetical protein E1B28_004979 [Marasmius oreades]|uniref:Uncharacterized protein n=1 Tax=Marasmius oreades TaxID=181124 RepID=A0A9P8ADJ2_9AGAR|nr:uncharacterized protein E1B28_004979 [Marasmius oreades]KAG7097647.1 hypothetical protein E1B28_004979 [Marasmius oreades]